MSKKAPPQRANPRLSDLVLEGSKPGHYEVIRPKTNGERDGKAATVHVSRKAGGGWSRKKVK
jgi:hypothetical protein